MNKEFLKFKLEGTGDLKYLAMNSHSLSHSALFEDCDHDVRTALTNCFSSGENPGFK